jgi:hypothetical protein
MFAVPCFGFVPQAIQVVQQVEQKQPSWAQQQQKHRGSKGQDQGQLQAWEVNLLSDALQVSSSCGSGVTNTVLLRMFGDFHQLCSSPICITIGFAKGVITNPVKR